MSSESAPISTERFAAALKDLHVSSLYGKAAELRNSIAHLLRSNSELQEYADAGDRDCAEAITENEGVVKRMEERISLLKSEVEMRGLRWIEEGQEHPPIAPVEGEALQDGDAAATNGTHTNGAISRPETNGTAARSQQQRSGRLTDEELQRILTDRMGEPSEEEGVHL